MQALIETSHAAVPRSHGRPILDSYDSGEEFSFHHWIEVCKLVDEADEPATDEEPRYSAEFEKALKETLSEVESSATYQHFAGHVV